MYKRLVVERIYTISHWSGALCLVVLFGAGHLACFAGFHVGEVALLEQSPGDLFHLGGPCRVAVAHLAGVFLGDGGGRQSARTREPEVLGGGAVPVRGTVAGTGSGLGDCSVGLELGGLLWWVGVSAKGECAHTAGEAPPCEGSALVHVLVRFRTPREEVGVGEVGEFGAGDVVDAVQSEKEMGVH